MQEIELKVLDIDIKKITHQLLKLGAKKIPTKLIVEKTYDNQQKVVGKKGALLRLRQYGEKNELTYKRYRKKVGPFRECEEIETEVANYSEAERILGLLGFKPKLHREKKRTTFELRGVLVEIDQYPSIPPYLEIEGSKKGITSTLKLLGIPFNKTTNLTATRVLKKYGVNFKKQKF